ncbi:MAG TPA: hypothetical protein VE439_11310 [Anaerolineae bacterium]|nr:hypothetical protein [Anaerolineae bacterium]
MKDHQTDTLTSDSQTDGGNEYSVIVRKLRQARLHIRLNSAWYNLLYSLLAVLAFTVLIELAFRIFIFDNRRFLEVVALIVIPALAVLWPFIRKISDFKCAVTVDLLFKTKERLSTAVELRNSGMQSRFSQKILADAARTGSTINPAEGFSYRPPNRILMAFASLILVTSLLLYLPNPGERVLADRKAFAKQLEAEKKALQEKRAEVAKNAELSKEDKKELLKKIDELTKELSRKNITKEEAVAKMAELEQELEKRKPAWGKSSDELLQRLARKMSGNSNLSALSKALKNRDSKAAAKEAKNLANLKQLSEGDRKRLASELSRMSDSASAIDPQLAQSLSKLSKALNNQQARDQDFTEASNQLAQAVGQAGQRASLEQMISSLSNQLSQGRQSIAQAGQQSQWSQQMASTNQSSSNSQSGNQSGGNQGSSQSGSSSSGQGSGAGNTPGSGSGNNSGNRSGSGGGAGGGGIGANSGARSGISSSANDFGNVRLNRERKSGKYESLYAPELIDANTRDEKLSGNKTQGEETVENVPLPPAREEALIPYTQAFYHYYDTAVESLNRGEIPPGTEEIIKNYFDSLRPDE